MSQKVRGQLGIDTMTDDITALLDALGIAGKVALAGVAVGGAIALHFAARYPERTSAVAVGSPATGAAPDRRAVAAAIVVREGTRRLNNKCPFGRTNVDASGGDCRM